MASSSGNDVGANNQNVTYSSTVAAAAQNLITVLTQNLSQGQHQPAQGGRQEQRPSSVDQEMARAITLHAVLRLEPMLEQLREGLQLYGLLELIKQHPDTCQPLFVQGEDVKVNAEFVMASIHPQLSEKGTTRHQVELEMLNFIQDFLYESEESPEHLGDEGGPRSVTPARFLQWITGQGHIPLLPSDKKDFAVVIKFNHDCGADFGKHSICYPVVSACAKTIVLPVKHMKSYDHFKMVLMDAFHLGQEFNNV